MGLMDGVKKGLKAEWDKAGEKIKDDKQKRDELDAQGIAYCPKCLSTSLSTQKKGGSIVKGLVGGAVLGVPGLLAGGIGRSKIEIYCMKCGYKFKA